MSTPYELAARLHSLFQRRQELEHELRAVTVTTPTELVRTTKRELTRVRFQIAAIERRLAR